MTEAQACGFFPGSILVETDGVLLFRNLPTPHDSQRTKTRVASRCVGGTHDSHFDYRFVPLLAVSFGRARTGSGKLQY